MKTYVLTVSRSFPSGHKRAGDHTFFVEKISIEEGGLRAIYKNEDISPKIHTIRANFQLWKKRFDEIEAGRACLSLRYWEGKPYRSKQVEFLRLTRDDGIGLQELHFVSGDIDYPCVSPEKISAVDDLLTPIIARNDGLPLDDFKDWFKGYDLSGSLAIIHFTNFRY